MPRIKCLIKKSFDSCLYLYSLQINCIVNRAMKQFLFIYIFLSIISSCNSDDKKKAEVKDSENVSEKAVQFPEEREDSIINKNNFETIKRPPVDSNGNAAGDGEKKKVNVEIKVFRNLESSGFGYDIILDGHTYVHQPNIPALPGNNGFSTEEKARSVAELVSFKIRNNIMPPTVEVRELDSLRVR